ncbi:MAG: hypothetical protein WC767_01890 [Candidatus Paceibacterota bacterium]|jgi:hypothetical protein
MRKILAFLSTKVGIAILLAIVVIGLSVMLKNRPTAKTSGKTGAALAVEKIVKKTLADDADGDGLKNWEEVLYKTDPDSADTDVDGVDDGDEVKQNRDPLVPGAGDTSAGETASSSSISFNATDRFSQELFRQYIEAKKSGREITPELSDQIAQSLLDKDYTNDTPDSVTAKDFKTVANTYDNLVAYGNSIGKASSTKLPPGAESEILLLEKIAADPALIEAADFKPALDRYKEMRTEILATAVPSSVLEAHVNIVNGLNLIIYATESMTSLSSDPIAVLSKIEFHSDGVDLVEMGILGARNVFTAKGIHFGPSEPGYLLVE